MNIVVLDGYTLNPGDNPWSQLELLAPTVIHENTIPELVVERSSAADILVVNKIKLTQEVIQQLPNLKFISITATGHDCVDSGFAQTKNITVSNVPFYGTDSVAQFVMAQLLELCHRIQRHDTAIRDGEWQKRGDFSFWLTPQVELADKTLGIIGFGRIGKRVAELARAFGMNVLVSTRTKPESLHDGIEFVKLDELLPQSDVVSLHCPLTEQTSGLVNQSFLNAMKPTAILLNTGRGGLVIESDLANALESNTIGAAALDVASTEPIRDDNPLLKAPNCVLTPHMAWATLEARKRLMQTTVENVRAFLAGKPIHVV